MNHSPKKIWAGALAALLALFAAVVVAATPAKADVAAGAGVSIVGGNITDPALVNSVFESTAGAGDSSKAISFDSTTNTITLLQNLTVAGSPQSTTPSISFTSPGSWTLDLNGGKITGNSLVVTDSSGKGDNPIGNDTVQCVIYVGPNVNLTIENGTIENVSSNSGVCGVCVAGKANVTFDNLTVNAGGAFQQKGTYMYPAVSVRANGALTVNESEEGETNITVAKEESDAADAGAAIACAGTLTMNGGTVTCLPTKLGAGIMVIGNGEATINDGAVNAGSGVLATQNATVNIKGGNITGTQAGVNLTLPYGEALENGDSATINISGGTITGGTEEDPTNAVYAGQEGGGKGAAPGNVNVTGGTLNGNVNNTGAVKSGVTISGGTVNGEVIQPGNNGSTTVSGGTFSEPVPSNLLDDTVGAMGISKNGYSYGETAADLPAGSTPVDITADGITILSVGFEKSSTAADKAAEAEAKKLGYTPEINISQNNTMWVFFYAAAKTGTTTNSYSANFAVNEVFSSITGIQLTSSNNIGFAQITLNSQTANGSGTGTTSQGAGPMKTAVAGNWKVIVSGAGLTSATSTTIPLAGLTYITSSSSTAGKLAAGTAVTNFYNVSNEPVENALPSTVPAVTESDGKTAAPLYAGWYELTPTSTTGSYTAALWNGEEYVPSSPVMTILAAGYTSAPDEGVTGELAINPQNFTTYMTPKVTLTVTVDEDAAGDSVALALPSGYKVTTKLQATEASMVQLVKNIVADSLSSKNISGNVTVQWVDADATTLTMSNWSTTPVALDKDQPTVSGNTVTAVMTFTPNKGYPKPYYVSIAVTKLDALPIAGSVTGEADEAEITQPAVLANGFPGVNVTVNGNGTVNQSVDSEGNITLTAVTANGSTFQGYTYKVNGVDQQITATGATLYIPANQVSQYSNGITAIFQGGTAPTPPTPADTVDITRLYNPYLNGAHLLSASADEVANLKAAGWTVEGTAFTEYSSASANDGQVVPVYRLYNPYNGDHFYTASNAEAETMKAGGWQREGTAWYAPVNSNVGVTRLYNPYMTENAGLGNHLWSANYSEVSPLIGVGWRDEGRAWFAVSAPSA